MRLAIDAMGNDQGCAPILDGVADFLADDPETGVILVGREDELSAGLAKRGLSLGERLSIAHASQVVEMDEKISSLREKKDSSIVRLTRLARDGEADGIVALGNTAAAVGSARLTLRHLAGVHRAGIAVPMPTVNGGVCVVIDMGATINAQPKHLYTYGIMASAYSKLVLGVENPRVGLLNVGEEEGKGSDFQKETAALLATAPINFVGNAEGRDIFRGTFDVIVCDGFVGNAVLKACEETAETLLHWVKDAIMTTSWLTMLGGWLCKPAFRRVKQKSSYDRHGGAPLLGVNGVCIIGHGRSNAIAVKNALRVARESVAKGLNQSIRSSLEGLHLEPEDGAKE